MTPRRCPQCGRENPQQGLFCVYCGAVLPLAAVETVSASAPAGVGGTANALAGLDELRRELIGLQALLSVYGSRLANLERASGQQPAERPSPEAAPLAPTAVAPPPGPPVESSALPPEPALPLTVRPTWD